MAPFVPFACQNVIMLRVVTLTADGLAASLPFLSLTNCWSKPTSSPSLSSVQFLVWGPGSNPQASLRAGGWSHIGLRCCFSCTSLWGLALGTLCTFPSFQGLSSLLHSSWHGKGEWAQEGRVSWDPASCLWSPPFPSRRRIKWCVFSVGREKLFLVCPCQTQA